MSGQRFGECVVLYRTNDYVAPGGEHDPQYICICDCGKEFAARGSNLRAGHTWCCGCKRKSSKAEQEINDYLTKCAINFERNYRFEDLRSRKNWKLPFDFALFDDQQNLLCLIEYQGEQHFESRKNDIFGYEQRKYTDKSKKEYCKQHNIPLYEITYKQNIIDELNKILTTTYHANTVPSLESEEGVTTIPQGST